MPSFDTAAVNHLDTEQVIRPAFFAWLDFLGDNIRATTAGYDITLSGTGDSELDGAYSAVDPTVVNISEVMNREGGSETVTASISGLLLPDAEIYETIANPANWQGRIARLWVQIRNEDDEAQGAIAPYYTGYMTAIEVVPTPESQTIRVRIENYLATLSEASNRTYQNQRYYDPNDASAGATISAANNARTGQASGAGYGGGGGSGGDGYVNERQFQQ